MYLAYGLTIRPLRIRNILPLVCSDCYILYVHFYYNDSGSYFVSLIYICVFFPYHTFFISDPLESLPQSTMLSSLQPLLLCVTKIICDIPEFLVSCVCVCPTRLDWGHSTSALRTLGLVMLCRGASRELRRGAAPLASTHEMPVYAVQL